MKAIDTNIIARIVLGDDEAQAQQAALILRDPVWISMTVWLELGWVLGRRLGLDREVVADAMATILLIETVHTPDPEGLSWAIERYRAGGDWADMLHLVVARGVADRFVTFDRAILKCAGSGSPVPIETLA